MGQGAVLILALGDHFTLDQGALGQSGDLDAGTSRRIGGEVFCIDAVQGCKLTQISHKDGGLDEGAHIGLIGENICIK